MVIPGAGRYSEITALYTNGLGNLIYFEGTDPRDPGVPNLPPVVGTPREQFEEGLTRRRVARLHGRHRSTQYVSS